MITVKEVEPGTFEPISGNPILTSLDGKVKAPLRTIMAPSWTTEDRAKFGVHLVEPFSVPEGKRATGPRRYEKDGGVIVELRDLEDVPAPETDTRTPTEKMEAFASMIGVTLDEMRSVLIEAKS